MSTTRRNHTSLGTLHQLSCSHLIAKVVLLHRGQQIITVVVVVVPSRSSSLQSANCMWAKDEFRGCPKGPKPRLPFVVVVLAMYHRRGCLFFLLRSCIQNQSFTEARKNVIIPKPLLLVVRRMFSPCHLAGHQQRVIVVVLVSPDLMYAK